MRQVATKLKNMALPGGMSCQEVSTGAKQKAMNTGIMMTKSGSRLSSTSCRVSCATSVGASTSHSIRMESRAKIDRRGELEQAQAHQRRDGD